MSDMPKLKWVYIPTREELEKGMIKPDNMDHLEEIRITVESLIEKIDKGGKLAETDIQELKDSVEELTPD